MAKRSDEKKPDAAAVDLEHLTQSQAAWLLQRPASWVRDNAHLILRNADGSYDGRRVIDAARRGGAPIELSDDDVEKSLRAAEVMYQGVTCGLLQLVEFLESLAVEHGDAGLAAFVRVFVEDAREIIAIKPDDYVGVSSLFEQAAVCDKCGKVRRGRKWIAEKKPKYAASLTCPSCLEK